MKAVVLGISLASAIASSLVLAQNIDPANLGERFVYGENGGWINFRPPAAGVTVTGTGATGFAYGENIGWINLAPSGGGVRNDGIGKLSGFAYGENVGWINFGPAGSGVRINACGEFSGFAYGENIGWLNFGPGAEFDLATSWVSPVDDVAPDAVATAPAPNGSGWYNGSVAVAIAATDCGGGVSQIRARVDARPEVIAAGGATSLTVSNEGIHTLSFFAIDQASNSETAQSLQVRIDKTAPPVSITSPYQDAVLTIHQSVPAAFTVADALSGVSFVVSTVANGAPIPTSIAGPQVFFVQAGDNAGNLAIATRNYNVVYPGNIDPANADAEFAYGENMGWINFKPSWGPGVMVTRTAVGGLAYAENVGWINLGPGGGGVVNDGTGKLSGFAYAENVGWINFGPQQGGVTIDPGTGRFSGFAYSENVGWINFATTGSALMTAWQATDIAPPVVTPPAGITVAATEGGGARASDSQALATFLNGATASDNLDAHPFMLPPLVGGLAVDGATVFPNGTTVVTFRFRDQSGSVGTALSSVTVTVGQPQIAGTIAGTGMDAGVFYVDLQLVNTGTGNARNLLLTDLHPQAAAGPGAVTLNTVRSPSLPISVGGLDVGETATVRIFLDFPLTVSRFLLKESGTLSDAAGTSSRYIVGQSITP